MIKQIVVFILFFSLTSMVFAHFEEEDKRHVLSSKKQGGLLRKIKDGVKAFWDSLPQQEDFDGKVFYVCGVEGCDLLFSTYRHGFWHFIKIHLLEIEDAENRSLLKPTVDEELMKSFPLSDLG